MHRASASRRTDPRSLSEASDTGHGSNRMGDESGSRRRTNLVNAASGALLYVVGLFRLVVLVPALLSWVGEESLGIFMIATTISGLTGAFSLGLAQATVKYVSEYRALGKRGAITDIVNATGMIYILIGATVAVGLVFAAPALAIHVFRFSPTHLADGIGSLRFAGASFFMFLMMNVVTSLAKGFERYDLVVPAVVGANLLTLVGQILLAARGYGVAQLVAAQAAALLVAFVIVCPIAIRQLIPGYRPAGVSRSRIREILGYSIYTWMTDLFGALRNQGDVLVVGGILGPVNVTYYTVAVRALNQLHLFLGSVFGYVFPYVSTLRAQRDTAGLHAAYDRYSLLVACISMCTIAPALALGEPILRTWLGIGYNPAMTMVLQIVAFRYAVYPLSIINGNFLMGTGQVRLLSLIVGINAVVSLVSIAVLAALFGLAGAAYGNLIACLGVAVNRAIIERTLFGRVDPRRVLLPVVSGLAAVAGTLTLIRRYPPDSTLTQGWVVMAAFGIAAVCAAALTLLMKRSRPVPQAAAFGHGSLDEFDGEPN
jgi:O-antigen/teichoic acid export membrane protein